MKLVPNAIGMKIARQSLQRRKSAPSLLFATGVAGMVGTTVLACRSTLRVEEILTKTRSDLQMAEALHLEHPESVAQHYEQTGQIREQYSDADYRKDVAVIYARAVVNTAKLYAPALILGAFSIGCLTKSHDILNERNAALTAAYVAVDEAFTRYRGRVVDKYGEDQDREFRYAHEEVEVVDENGKMTQETRVTPEAASMYARFFDEYSSNWSKEAEYNIVFLRCQQKWANDMLKIRGHMFLNEVYDSLGLERTTAGSVVGWVVSPDSDNFIDFGIFADREGRGIRDFFNGREGSILLDFNVDGVIYDKIDTHKERLQWQS